MRPFFALPMRYRTPVSVEQAGFRWRMHSALRVSSWRGRKNVYFYGYRIARFTIEPPPQVQCEVHQPDHHGHLDQRPDHGREGGRRVDAEHADRHGNGQLEVVARRRPTVRRPRCAALRRIHRTLA